GAFTKYLGPIRWSFDCAGVHFVGMDWSLIDNKGHIQCGLADSAIDWLEKDLESLPRGTPAYFLSHQAWSPHKRFFEVCSKRGVKLCLGGHSHRNMFLGNHGGVEYWTKMSHYTLVYIDKSGFEFVDRCIYRGGRNGWDGHWHHNRRGCALYTDPAAEKKERSDHTGLEDVTLASASKSTRPVEGPTYDIRVGAKGTGDRPARRFGLRITAAGNAREFVYDDVDDMLDLMGRRTYFDPAIPFARVSKATDAVDPEEQTWIEMRIHVMPDRVRVIVNSRLHYQKFVKLGPAERIEIFAEDGEARFERVDLWRRTWPADWKRRATANTG
ncbi:MAG: metallophosphoesterase family protein, partial [Planctomycetota bacterium]